MYKLSILTLYSVQVRWAWVLNSHMEHCIWLLLNFYFSVGLVLLFGLLGSDSPFPVELATAKNTSFLMSLNFSKCRWLITV